MIMTQNAANLTIVAGALLTATITYYIIETKKQRNNNTTAYHKLSSHNKQIIDTIHKTEKTTTPTLNNIKLNYQETTQQYIDTEQLLETLTSLEKTGIIKNTITNRQDEPIQTWKTQINTPNNTLQK
jgi:hypothetical protein